MPDFQLPEFPQHLNMARYFLDARLEEGLGDRTAIHYKNQTITYSEVDRGACQVANTLGDLGLRPENRILLVLPDRPEFATTFFAALRMGAVVTMANPLLPEADFEYLLDYTRARMVVTHQNVLERIAGPIQQSRWGAQALVVEADPEKLQDPFFSFENETKDALETFTTLDTHRDDVAMWLFTSGTTGKSKGAIHRHIDFPYNTECFAKGVLGYQPEDVTLAVSKLFFGYATGTNLMFPFAVGASTALFEERSTPAEMNRMIEEVRPSILAAVPTTLRGMLAIPEEERSDLSCLRFIVSAGEALPPEIYRRFREMYNVEILDGIGSAEMFHIYVTNFPGKSKLGTLGKEVPGYEVELLDDNENPVPEGEVGTMWVQGETAALGYWNDHAKSIATFQGNRCNTGDRFTKDDQGYYYYCGRGDDLLKVGGIWVSPLEVEDCLLQHDTVKEVCVVGYEEDGLTKALAFVALNDGVTPLDSVAEAIRTFAKERLVKYKVPKRIAFVDALPRNDRGKIQRKVLKERAVHETASPSNKISP